MSYTIYTDPPQSRNEEILKATIDGTSYDKEPQSRIEDLLLELKAAIEGGGGGGTTNYNALENRPQVNGHTLEGDMSFADLGIDETPTEDSTNAVSSGGVYAGLADKIDKSSSGYQTITGNPLEFNSPAPQKVGMKCDIVPSQDLHGYDKPWAGGEGKNKFIGGDGATESGVTATKNADGSYSFSGTATGPAIFTIAQSYELPSGSYILSGGTPEIRLGFNYDDVRVEDTGSGVHFDLTGSGITWVQIVIIEGTSTDGFTIYPMIRLATETDPTFEPYSNICPISGTDTIDIDVTGGESYTVDLDGTRYGGTLDVISGVLTLTHGYVVLSKDDGWSRNVSASHSFMCTKDLEMVQMWGGDTRQNGISNCGICDSETAYWGVGSAFAYNVADNALYIGAPNCTSLDDFKAFLDSVSYEICGKLATPQTVQLTPTQVWAVQGGNTITVSVDGVEAVIHSSAYATLQDINDLWDYIKQLPQGGDGVRFGASNLEMIGGTMP